MPRSCGCGYNINHDDKELIIEVEDIEIVPVTTLRHIGMCIERPLS